MAGCGCRVIACGPSDLPGQLSTTRYSRERISRCDTRYRVRPGCHALISDRSGTHRTRANADRVCHGFDRRVIGPFEYSSDRCGR